MNKDVRFGWLGESRCEALQTLLSNLVHDWAYGWWLGAGDGVVEVCASDAITSQSSHSSAWVATHDEGALAIYYLGGKDMDAVGRYLTDVTTDADSELARRVGEEATADLIDQILRRAGMNPPPKLTKAAVPVSVEHIRLGAFHMGVTIGRLQFSLSIDRHIADRLVPPFSTGSKAGLVSRQAAIQTASLEMVASMDFGSIDLAHLSDLSVGEVLVGDRKLHEGLRLHLTDHGTVALGFLRRLGEQRAVILDDIHQHERQQP